MENELWELADKLRPWFDIDKVKPYAIYVWTKDDPNNEDNPFGTNVFDIYADCLQFYSYGKPWQIPSEALTIIHKIQEKLKEIERYLDGEE